MNTSPLLTHCLGIARIDMVIAVIIFTVLGAIAYPTFVHYNKKAAFAKLVMVAERYKSAVEICIAQQEGKLNECDAGKHGIPSTMVKEYQHIKRLTVEDGKIILMPKTHRHILSTDTYVLTPIWHGTETHWLISGGACLRGLVMC